MKNKANSLIQKLLKFREERDWKQFHTPKNLTISIAVETAELLSIFQWVKDSGMALGATINESYNIPPRHRRI